MSNEGGGIGKSPVADAFRRVSFAIFESSHFTGTRLFRQLTIQARYVVGLAIVSLLMGIDPDREGARLLLSLCVGSLAFSILHSKLVSRQSVALTRILPERVLEGEPFEYRVIARNSGTKRSLPMDIRDHGKMRFPTIAEWKACDPEPLRGINLFDRIVGYPKWLYMVVRGQDFIGADLHIPALDPGAQHEACGSGVAFNRGQRMFIGFYCAVSDPLQLLRRVFFTRTRQSCLVIPSPLDPLVSVDSAGSKEGVGFSHDKNRCGNSEEFRSLREWRAGDPLKKIDWKATARMGKPIAREHFPETSVRSAVAFDTFDPDYETNPLPFETSVKRACGMVLLKTATESNVDVVVVGDEAFVVNIGQDGDHLPALDLLAAAKPSESDNFPALAKSLSSLSGSVSGMVVFSSCWTPERRDFFNSMQASGIDVRILLSVPKGTVVEPGLVPATASFEAREQ